MGWCSVGEQDTNHWIPNREKPIQGKMKQMKVCLFLLILQNCFSQHILLKEPRAYGEDIARLEGEGARRDARGKEDPGAWLKT